tara:strand:+ start:2305 stop:2556 length:252 start_codon:yes stop_codon:yes gene_type:complete
MIEPLAKWQMERYSILWNKFKDKEFSNEQARKVLKEKDKQFINVLLSDLRKAEWLEVKFNKEDTRKRLYKLKEPNQAVKEMIK